MIQQGQVFRLTAKGGDGQPLWAYRYRLEGGSSARPQVGGFASRADAQKALRKALDRIGPERGGAVTLAELVEEYLELHQAEPVTIGKLRWLLGKATSALGEKRIADLSPKDVYAWRLTIPEGHRFEATQAAAGSQPRGRLGAARPQPGEARYLEPAKAAEGKAAVRVLGTDRGDRCSARTGVRTDGDLRGSNRAATVRAVRARATRRRPQRRRRLCAACVRERQDQEHLDPAEHTRGSAAGEGSCGARPAASLCQPNPVPERSRRPDRLPRLWPPSLAARAGRRGHRTDSWLYNLRHTYATFALRAGVPVFAVSRFIGSSIAMIDRHYGHLARDSHVHAVSLLDALAVERAVDATWTSNRSRAIALSNSDSKPHRRRTNRRVDAGWTPRLVLVTAADNERS
jgi:hypothetical protein